MKKALLTMALVAGGVVTGFGEQKIAEEQMKWAEFYRGQGRMQSALPEPAEMLLNTEKEPDLSEGFVALFDGKSLDGWTAEGGNCTFEVKDGMVVGTNVKGSPSTYLCSPKKDYTDFIFSGEIRQEVDGNTGFIFRGKTRPGKNGFLTVFGPQIEMEEESKERFWSGGIYAQSCGGWAYPLWLEQHEEARKAAKPGEWNRLTVKAVGGTMKTWINGVPAAHLKTDKWLEGFFALQVHAGRQGTVWFRNLKVKEF